MHIIIIIIIISFICSLLPNSIIQPSNLSPNKFSLQFSVRWRVDTGKCVDSSPLLCCGLGGGPVVFIGSHSGLFLCLEECSGTVKWRQQLPDRIESSPCLSLCGHFVAVGKLHMYVHKLTHSVLSQIRPEILNILCHILEIISIPSNVKHVVAK